MLYLTYIVLRYNIGSVLMQTESPGSVEQNGHVGSSAHHVEDELADFSTNRRVLLLSAMALVIGAISSLVAYALIWLIAAITTLLTAGISAGTIRADVEPNDVLLALSGVSLAAGAPDQREQAGRLLDLLVDGLRHHASGPTRS